MVCVETKITQDNKRKGIPLLDIQSFVFNSFPGVYQPENHNKT